MPVARPSLAKLAFKEKILQKGGKSSSGDALQRRLKSLHEQLKTLEQDQTDISSLAPFKNDLIHETVLLHKDKGVKAYSACCIADMLRLYAPEAPYTENQLKDIFQFFLVQIVQNLKQPSGKNAKNPGGANNASVQRITDVPYYNEYYYLLESLATIKSVCLVTDLPESDGMILEFFEGFFSIVRPDMSKNLLRFLHEILTALIEESPTLPDGVLDCLLSQIETYAETPTHSCFVLATGVMRVTAHRLQRYVHQHFQELQIEHASDPTEEDLKALAKSQKIMVTLFRFCPDVLLNAISLLEENLRGEDLDLRVMSTKTVGEMFGSKGGPSILSGAGGTTTLYRTTWQAWLSRRADKAVGVRLAWLQGAAKVLVFHQESRKEICAAVSEKLSDVDDRVRAAGCKLFGELDYEIALHHVEAETLLMVGERLKDRKTTVGCQAVESLGKLYGAAYTEIESNDESAIRQFSWIPGQIYSSLYDNPSTAFRRNVELVTFQSILPLPAKADDEAAWVDRLLGVCQYLDSKAFKALLSLTNLMEPGVTPWQIFVKTCEVNNGGVIERDEEAVKLRLAQIIGFLSGLFPEPSQGEKALHDFADANDKRLYKELLAMTDIQADLKTVMKAQTEFTRRLAQSLPQSADILDIVLRTASRWIINRSSIAGLLKRAARPDSDPLGVAAQRLLAAVAKYCSPLLRTHVPELLLALADKKSVRTVEVAIQSLAQVCRADPSCVPRDKKCTERASKLCTEGSARQAKFAARFLTAAKQNDACLSAIKAAINAVKTQDLEILLPSLAALAEFAHSRSPAFTANASAIIDLVKTKVMLGLEDKPRTESGDDLEKWLAYDSLPLIDQAKVLSVRLLRNYCMAIARDENVRDKAKVSLSTLVDVVQSQGQLRDTDSRISAVAGHLRLAASLALVKMASHTVYDGLIDNVVFEEISFTTQDVYFAVRHEFLAKYHKYISRRKHTSRWYIIPFLSAHDPEPEVREMGSRMIRDLTRRMDAKMVLERIERPFVRLLLLLSHHPDFENTEIEDLQAIAKYIELYLDTVANSNNVSLLYYLATALKTVKDVQGSGDRLYILSDLSQYLLQQKANTLNWTLGTYTGEQRLPRSVFEKLPADEAKEISKKNFLPDDIDVWLHESKKTTKVPKAPRAPRTEAKKRPAAPKPKKASKRRRKNVGGDTIFAETESEDEDEGYEEDEAGNQIDTEQLKMASRQERYAARRRRNGFASSDSDLTDPEDE